LARITRQAPRGVIFAQRMQALGDIALIEPFNGVLLPALHGLQPFRGDELNRTGAILSNMRNQRKGVAGRDLKFLPPSLQYNFVVGKKAPQKGFDYVGTVLSRRQWHGQ
jgi:hypothetical protein